MHMKFEDPLRKMHRKSEEKEHEARERPLREKLKIVKQGGDLGVLDEHTGKDKEVFIHPDDPSRIVKKYHFQTTAGDANQFNGRESRTIEQQSKVNFYLQRLLHTLFPDNIPNRHVAGTQPKFTIDQRFQYRPHAGTREPSDKPGASGLIDALRQLDIHIDRAYHNFGEDKSGNWVYIDDLHIGKQTIKLLESAIHAIENEETKQKATKALERLTFWAEQGPQ